MEQEIEPTALEGTHVRLEPLAEQHAESLYHAGKDPKIWVWMTRSEFESVDDTKMWIQYANHMAMLGEDLPFAIIDKKSGMAVGSTRLLNIDINNRTAEVGWNWLTPRHWRTATHSECQLLLLGHAFDALQLYRIQMCVDTRNIQAINSFKKIGATQEGILRSIHINYDGHRCDYSISSILDFEWPKVKATLEKRLSS